MYINEFSIGDIVSYYNGIKVPPIYLVSLNPPVGSQTYNAKDGFLLTEKYGTFRYPTQQEVDEILENVNYE